jgi:hypothetical protein
MAVPSLSWATQYRRQGGGLYIHDLQLNTR